MKEKITKEKLNEDLVIALNEDLVIALKEIAEWEASSIRRRQEFSNLLDGSPRITDSWGHRKEKADLMSWEEIFFRMGELKADADYSCVLQAREDLKEENRLLLDQLQVEKNKPTS